MKFTETATITLARYNDMKEEIACLEMQRNDYLKMKELFFKAREMLIKHNINKWSLENNDIEELTNIEQEWSFGLHNAQELLEVITLEEMVEFIKKEKERIDKE